MKPCSSRCLAEALEARRMLAHPAFLVPSTYPVGATPSAPITADFNGDGKLDLAVSSGADNSIGVLLNRGNGTFAPKVDIALGRSITSFTAADLNGDGRPDLAVAFGEGFSGTVRVLLNRGDGTFDFFADKSVEWAPSSMQGADFNGDGRTDLALLNSSQYGGVIVLLNNGDATFGTPAWYPTRPNSTYLIATDLTGDNRADLAMMAAYDGSVRVLLNQGDGTFVPTADYLVGWNPRSLAAADFNGDNRVDLAVSVDGAVRIFLNNGNGSFAPSVFYRINQSPYAIYTSIAVGDFNGDGKPDIASNSQLSFYHNPFALVLNNGDGTFGTPIEYPTGSPWASMIAADFNNDGLADLASTNGSYLFANSELSVRLNGGGSIFAPRTDYPGGSRPAVVVAGDFTSDGKADLISADLFVNNGNGTFVPKYFTDGGPAGIAVAVADFDDDGKTDLIVDRLYALGVQLGNGDGTFGPVFEYLYSSGGYRPGFQLTIGDFNGDGIPDFAATAYRSTSLTVLLNDGNGTFAPAGDYPYSGLMTAADFTGDGSIDLAVSIGSQVQLLLNDGSGSFTVGGAYPAGAGALVSADFDGNGKADLAVSGSGGLWILLNVGGGTFATRSYPFAGGSVVAADFNRDRRPDLAITDLPGQNLKLLLNDGRGGFPIALGYSTGGYPTSIIAADFNNDRKPDLAWVNSMSNSLSVMLNVAPPILGAARPGLAAFDGKPRADIAAVSSRLSVKDLIDGLGSVPIVAHGV